MPSLRRHVLPLLLVVATFLLPPAFGPADGPLGLTSVWAQDDPLQATTRTVNVELILDASGSMAELLPEGETRIAAAKRILRQTIAELPERPGVNVGLRVYGHQGDNTQAGKAASCRASQLLVPVSGVDKDMLLAQVDAIQPTGWTPIAYSLQQAAADFQPGGESITNAIVLVTDGEETCDPPEQTCQAAAALRQAGISVTTHVVGFALTEQQTNQVRCIAEQGGGQLFGADNAAELGEALTTALQESGVPATPVPPVVPAASSLANIHTLAYHQLTVWTAGVDGTGERAPLLSDDGQTVAFTRDPGSGDPANPNRIFVMNADGSGEREVDAYQTLCFCSSMIDISGNGSRVVSSEGVQLRIAETSGGGGRELVTGGEINAVRISGDGNLVVFRIYRSNQQFERGIWVINADGTGLRQVVGPAQMGPLQGVAPEAAPFFGGTSGLDVSANGGQIVFTAYAEVDPATGSAREALFAVNSDGSNLHRLLGPTFTYVLANAISGDGSTVAYITSDAATGRQEAGVAGFDGSGARVLTDNTTPHPYTGNNLPSGERIQLSGDGSRLLLGSTGLLFDTRAGAQLALGLQISPPAGQAALVPEGLPVATMDTAVRRLVYLFQPAAGPMQLARLDLNPTELVDAPMITEARLDPNYVLIQNRSTATVSARISPLEPAPWAGGRVLRNGLPDDASFSRFSLVDDGTTGDVAASDGVFTNTIGTAGAEVGLRSIRIQAERVSADGRQQALAVDIAPFAVVEDRADAPAASPAAPTLTPTGSPTPTTTATPAPTATGACQWTGTWSTSYGTMRLTQSDSTVSGDYEHDQGQIRGTVSGRVLSGTWDEAPSRQPPSDAGEIEFTMAEDCQSFTGRWRYDASGELQPGWDGQLQGGPTPTPTVPPTVTPVPPTVTPTGSPTPTTATPPSDPAQATIAAQATLIAELQGQTPTPTPAPATPTTPSPTAHVGAGTPSAAEFITPDPAECTVTPRTADQLAALAASPDQAATDALAAAFALPGLDTPAGQPADEATTAAVLATYQEITACFNAGNSLAAYALWTDRALRQLGFDAPTGPQTPVPEGERGAFRVSQIQVLPDGRIAAVWEEQRPLVLVTTVQALVREGDRYLVDETFDFAMRSE